MQEKKLLTDYFDQIAQDTGLYCFGVEDTLRGLDMGAVETLIMWESLSIMRHVVRNSQNEIVVIHCQSGEETTKAKDKFIDSATGTQMEAAEEPMLLVDWMAENYREFGTTLEVCVDLSYPSLGSSRQRLSRTNHKRVHNSCEDSVASEESSVTRSTCNILPVWTMKMK